MADASVQVRAPARVATWLLRGVIAMALLVIAAVAILGEPSRSAYAIPAGLMLAAAVSLRARAPVRANAAAFLIVVAPLPWCADFVLGWVEQRGYAAAERAQRHHTIGNGWKFDERTLQAAIDETARTIGDAVPAMHPAAHLIDVDAVKVSVLTGAGGGELLPLAGISGVTTVTGPREGGRYFTFRADERGFNNPGGVWDAPRLDIAVIGDSYAHGVAVSSDSNLAAPVRRRWPLTLNLGYRGNGPLIELASLLEYLPQRKPRVVLWIVCEVNDIAEDLDRESRSALLRRYLQTVRPLQALEQRQPEIDSVLRAHLAVTQRPATATSPRLGDRILPVLSLHRLRRTVEATIRPLRDDWSLFADVLRAANVAVREWGGTMYVVYLPVHVARRESALVAAQRGPPAERRARIRAIGDSLRIPFIDVETAFERAGPAAREFFYPYRAHFTAAGYMAAGAAIVQRIEEDEKTRGREDE